MLQAWKEEAENCTKICTQDNGDQIRIAWHNVNGLKSFIKALSLEHMEYFLKPELYPDVFGILEAQLSEEDPELSTLLDILTNLLHTITGARYVSLR